MRFGERHFRGMQDRNSSWTRCADGGGGLWSGDLLLKVCVHTRVQMIPRVL